MIVEENNEASIRGIEKAGFVRYAFGRKTKSGVIVIV
jgi:RimJ/RimL family protein N-acetyltransferase